MKLIESADGTIRVMELDPTKKHILVIDHDALSISAIQKIRLVNGEIILKRPGSEITVIEGETLPDAVALRPAAAQEE